MTILTSNTALVIIDVQDGLDDPILGKRNNPHAEDNMARILAEWRSQKRPIFHIQHMSTEPNSPLRPEKAGNAIKQVVAPQSNEPVIQKKVNNAFVGTDLEARLRAKNIETVVMMGLTTDHCVSTTVRMAGDLGFDTYVVADATAAHESVSFDGKHYTADDVHQIALVNLHREFATIVYTDDLISE